MDEFHQVLVEALMVQRMRVCKILQIKLLAIVTLVCFAHCSLFLKGVGYKNSLVSVTLIPRASNAARAPESVGVLFPWILQCLFVMNPICCRNNTLVILIVQNFSEILFFPRYFQNMHF